MNPIDLQNLVERTFVSYVEHHAQIDSTNNRARRIALGTEPLRGHASPSLETLRTSLPCLIVADRQSAGRGRGTNRWWTGPGSLAASLLMPPVAAWPQLFPRSGPTGFRSSQPDTPGEGTARFSSASSTSCDSGSFCTSECLVESSTSGEARSVCECGPEFQPGLIGLAAALAVLRTVQPRLPGLSVGLHWPNDVFAAGKKLAGILVEVLNNGLVVVGIGVNTNNTVQEAPEELRPLLTTLRDLSGQIHPHEHLLPELLEYLKDVFSQVVHSPDRLASDAHQWCLQRGQLLKVQTAGGVIEGLCEGIGSRGELLLHTSNGLRQIFSGCILR